MKSTACIKHPAPPLSGGRIFLYTLCAFFVLLVIGSIIFFDRNMKTACEHGDFFDVLILLSANRKLVNEVSNYDGETPLHVAKSKKSAELLIDNHAAIELRDNDGMTPLHCAAKNGKWEVAETLLAHHADINIPDSSGKTPLQMSKTCDNKMIEKFLREQGGVK